MPPTSFLALDFGPPGGFTALAIVEYSDLDCEAHDRIYHLRHLHRYPMGTPYPEIIADVAKNIRPAIRGPLTIIVDQTGVGRGLSETVARAFDYDITRVAISAGHASTLASDWTRLIPKVELVTCLQLLLQSRRLRIADSLP